MIRLPPKVLVRMQSDPGFGIAPLDGQHAIRMSQVPRLAAVPLLQAGEHELGAHSAVAEQRIFRNRV